MPRSRDLTAFHSVSQTAGDQVGQAGEAEHAAPDCKPRLPAAYACDHKGDAEQRAEDAGAQKKTLPGRGNDVRGRHGTYVSTPAL